jgi:hypothetical protein
MAVPSHVAASTCVRSALVWQRAISADGAIAHALLAASSRSRRKQEAKIRKLQRSAGANGSFV